MLRNALWVIFLSPFPHFDPRHRRLPTLDSTLAWKITWFCLDHSLLLSLFYGLTCLTASFGLNPLLKDSLLWSWPQLGIFFVSRNFLLSIYCSFNKLLISLPAFPMWSGILVPWQLDWLPHLDSTPGLEDYPLWTTGPWLGKLPSTFDSTPAYYCLCFTFFRCSCIVFSY